MPRAVLIGLDCLAPSLVFDRWGDELPTFARLRAEGAWGELTSVDPPITVPAWACLFSGRSPAELGLYGFRHRRLGSYGPPYRVTSEHLRLPCLWDRLSAAGLTTGLLGVPLTFPPPAAAAWCAGDFLAPSLEASCRPPELAQALVGMPLDVEHVRGGDLDRIAADAEVLSEQRFARFQDLLQTRPVDFAAMVDLAPDRMHHAFWRFDDPAHPLHVPGHRHSGTLRAFYQRLDQRLGRLLASLPPDCHVLVASDHGAQALQGGFCVNDWLRARGLLALRGRLGGPRPFEERLVDFGATRVWAWGGYYARLFVNLRGREPQGTVAPDDYEALLRSLTEELEALLGPDGLRLGCRVQRPRDLAPDGVPRGDWPDLMVYVGGLRYRALASVGNPALFARGNDTGPDDANHAMQGVFLHRGPGVVPGRREGLRLLDVAARLGGVFGLGP